MNGRLTRSVAFAAAAILTALPAQVNAQASVRYRVLVPDFFPAEGVKKNFGEDVAKELRKALDGLGTHQPIERNEIRDELKAFDLKIDELDCFQTRQLATQINAQVALCASYTEQDDTRDLSAITIWDITTGEPLEIEGVTVTGKEAKVQAAEYIFAAFDRMVELAKAQQFCADYANSRQWDNAMGNCDKALDLNPNAMATRQRKARILFEQAQEETDEQLKKAFFQRSLEELETVLGSNPFHEEALQRAGFVSIQLDDPEGGRVYYERYLEVNPGADQIRLNIAFDMSQAGDPEGAMGLIQVGIDAAPDNADLLEYYAGYGFAAANKRVEAAKAANSEVTSPEGMELYRQVIDALNKVRQIRGADMAAAQMRTLIAAHLAVADAVAAEVAARQALEVYPREAPAIWYQLAEAIQRQGRVDEAVQTLTTLEEIQPDYPNLNVLQANWLMEDGRLTDAVPYFQRAVENGTDANLAGRIVYGDAANNGIRTENWAYAVRGIRAAKTFNVNSETRAELNFWHGWAIYHQAMAAQEPQNLASANQTKPVFEQAKQLFTAGSSYAAGAGVNLQQVMDAVDTYIEIQTVLIRRGR
jgi:tetratricopeptide (TPR) repeat protein